MAIDITNRLQKLRTTVRARNAQGAFDILNRLAGTRDWPRAGTPESFELLLEVAECCDLGYGDHRLMESHLAPFMKIKRESLPLTSYLQLRLAEAYLYFSSSRFLETSELLGSILRAHIEVLHPHSIYLAWLWRGRAERASGSFDEALVSIKNAREMAHARRFERLEAGAKIHESWLLFYRGDRKGAFSLLDEAEVSLTPTKHALSLGNIAATRGRFHRSTGDYRRSIKNFDQAISLYRSQAPCHPDLAQALVNAAYAKRLEALQLQPVRGGKASAAIHVEMLAVVKEAMDMLRDARHIYDLNQHASGSASVMIHMGHLYLESGEIEAATQEAEAVISLAEERGDPTLRARAHILGAYVEMTRSEEQLESSWYSGSPAQHAVDLSERAIEFAAKTKNARLLAAARITRGLAATDPLQADWETASRHSSAASELLENDERDHLFNELTALRRRIHESQNLDSIWRRWSSGETNGETFQQIEEQFAALVIARVWTNLGENISAVSRQLRISPKKVRRVLLRAKQLRDDS